MCFSATATLLAAAVTGVIGIVALRRARSWREVPLATTPMVFALQQAVEGMLWLTLPVAPDGSIATGLTDLYLFFAQVFWPVFVPVAVVLVEPEPDRRRLILGCLVAGVGVGGYFLWSILTHQHGAMIEGGHIVYLTVNGTAERDGSALVSIAYLAATALALMLSSQRSVVTLGVIVIVGAAVTYAFYWEAFVSVWCLFAAVASVAVVWHFERSHRQHLRTARI